MYLDHTFARKTFAQRNHFTFWLKRVLRLLTFAQQIGSAKVKSKIEVTHCMLSDFILF